MLTVCLLFGNYKISGEFISLRFTKKEHKMEPKTYKLTKIEGEYAYLSPIEGGEELFIALALLPIGADIGSLLLYENFEFSLFE